jgi:hypothetical protein
MTPMPGLDLTDVVSRRDRDEEHPLLVALDALVRRDPGPPGVVGVVCVVVRDGVGDTAWCARFGETVRLTVDDAPPVDADAVLRLDARAADAVLAGTAIPADAASTFTGNDALFERFARRYLGRMTWLGARVSSMRRSP